MKLLAIDGNSIINRAFYGIRPLSTKTGVPTNALYGFLNILLKHIQLDKPDFVCVAFDLKDKTFRHNIYDGYKATRKPMPEELAEQLLLVKRFLDIFKIARIEQSGLEADDILGILSRLCTERGDECIIVTGDRDALQLINKNTTIKLATAKQGVSEDIVYDREKVFEKYELYPESLIDLKALMGDASDNIPGVKGIGEKTAITLLKKYGNLDEIYKNADDITGAVGEKLRADKENAYMSKKLGTIATQNDIGLSVENFKRAEPDKKELLNFLNETEMNSFIKRFSLDEEKPVANKVKIPLPRMIENDTIFDGKEIFVIIERPYIVIKDGDELYTILSENIALIAKSSIITHDAKPLIHIALQKGINLNIVFDTMLAAYLADASRPEYSIMRLFNDYSVNYAGDYFHVSETAKDKTIELDTERPLLAAAEILCSMPALYKSLNELLEKEGLKKLFYEIELPLCFVLADMEITGFKADKDFLIKFGEETEQKLNELSVEIFKLAGKEFNINSPKQLGVILFEEIGLKSMKKTKTGYSTDNEVLENLADEHPIILNIIDYRKLSKLKSTYVDGLLKNIAPDGRIHTSFTQTVTQTGRISSIEPNLQNIPVRTPLGRQLRHAFIADEGKLLADADYSQIELRILAHISDDEVMKNAFMDEKDIHTITASQVFGMPQNMITPEMRSRAKAVNFGIVYGIGDYSLSKDLGISRKEARSYIDGYLNTYKGVALYMQAAVEFAKKNNYVETLFGRRRYVPEINAKNKQQQAFGERISMNTPIQGTAADIIKLAMIKVYNSLKANNLTAKLVLQVHDELIIETPENEKDKVAEILQHEMENAVALSVPLTADVGIGKDWFESH